MSCGDRLGPAIQHVARGAFEIRRRGGGDPDALRVGEPAEIARRGLAVGGVIVLDQQPRDELAPGAARRERLPAGDLFPPMEGDEAVELRLERAVALEEMAVLLD